MLKRLRLTRKTSYLKCIGLVVVWRCPYARPEVDVYWPRYTGPLRLHGLCLLAASYRNLLRLWDDLRCQQVEYFGVIDVWQAEDGLIDAQ